jgi:hypothetical protein
MGHPIVVFLFLLLCMRFCVSEWCKNLTVVINHTWLFVDGYTQCQDFREFYYWVSCTVAWLFEDEEYACVRRIRESCSWPKDQPRVWCATRGICTREPQRRCWRIIHLIFKAAATAASSPFSTWWGEHLAARRTAWKEGRGRPRKIPSC